MFTLHVPGLEVSNFSQENGRVLIPISNVQQAWDPFYKTFYCATAVISWQSGATLACPKISMWVKQHCYSLRVSAMFL
jgi:hypothetical protein